MPIKPKQSNETTDQPTWDLDEIEKQLGLRQDEILKLLRQPVSHEWIALHQGPQLVAPPPTLVHRTGEMVKFDELPDGNNPWSLGAKSGRELFKLGKGGIESFNTVRDTMGLRMQPWRKGIMHSNTLIVDQRQFRKNGNSFIRSRQVNLASNLGKRLKIVPLSAKQIVKGVRIVGLDLIITSGMIGIDWLVEYWINEDEEAAGRLLNHAGWELGKAAITSIAAATAAALASLTPFVFLPIAAGFGVGILVASVLDYLDGQETFWERIFRGIMQPAPDLPTQSMQMSHLLP
jgi:hypothetical protein